MPSIREEDIGYTQSADGKAIYAYVLRRGANTKVSMLGYGEELVEYKQGLDGKVYTAVTPQGLQESALRGQRFYTNYRWPNAVVLKIEGATYQAKTAGPVPNGIDGAN